MLYTASCRLIRVPPASLAAAGLPVLTLLVTCEGSSVVQTDQCYTVWCVSQHTSANTPRGWHRNQNQPSYAFRRLASVPATAMAAEEGQHAAAPD
jgi:hypothetical protein